MYFSTHTIHEKEKDLDKKRRENPSLRPIYLKVEDKDGATEISLSREGGEAIYCLSNSSYDNLLDYFKINNNYEEKKSKEAFKEAEINVAKKHKQGSIFNFITTK